MTIASSDLVYVFSGGTSNFDPNLSLGGDPSSVAIGDISNNLFDLLDANQLQEGIVDYRCFYIFNQNDTETLYDFSVYVQNTSVVSCLVGLKKQNEIQKITLSGSPTTGNIIMDYNDEQFTVEFSPDPNQLALNFQQQLVDLGLLGTTVTAESKTGYYTVTITFGGDSGYKYHPLMKLIANNLSPATSFFIEKIQEGSPINMIFPKTPNLTTAPENIEFFQATPTEPLLLASLRPYEGIPIWLKRIVPAATSKNDNLHFSFKIKGRIIS